MNSIKCKHCESTWESKKQFIDCPFCGESLAEKPPEPEDVLKKIFEESGKEILTDGSKLIESLSAEESLQDKKLQNLLKNLVVEGIAEKLSEIETLPDTDSKQEELQNILNTFTENTYFPENISIKVINYFCKALQYPLLEEAPELHQKSAAISAPIQSGQQIQKNLPEKVLTREISQNMSGETINIDISEGYTDIAEKAFNERKDIKTVVIPNGVISIGGQAFYECSSLTNITLPNSVTTIGGRAFAKCSSLLNVTLPNSVTTIGGRAFLGCSSLISVIIPSSVKTIGDATFGSCTALTGLNIPNGVTTIGYQAFVSCTSLANVSIPGSVTTIGENAFGACSSIVSIVIPNSVVTIGEQAFFNCSAMKRVTLSNRTTTIGMRTFGKCSSLEKINIPDSVTTIRDAAFTECTNLTSVTIPNSVTDIAENAFEKCPKLTVNCLVGSYAHEYCKEHQIGVRVLSE